MKIRILITVGLTVFVAAVLVSTPAAWVSGLLARQAGAPQLLNPGGTLFHGSAAALAQGPHTLLRDLRWSLRPSALLRGQLAFEIESAGDPSLDGIVAAGLGGHLSAHDLRATGDLRPLLSLAGPIPLPVTGQFGLQLDRAEIVDRWPAAVQGALTLHGLSWLLAAHPLALGDFRADLETGADGLITAHIKSVQGPIDAQGSAHLRADRHADIDLLLRAQPDADPMIVNMLRTLGTPDAQGWYHLRQQQAL